MAQGVAYAARLRGVPATIVVPEGAPATKIAAIERFGGTVVALPYDDWWRVLVEGRYDGAPGLFVHPVDDLRVMAGNGTIGLEILEDLPDSTRSSSPTAAAACHRDRERGQGVAARGALLRRRARDRRRRVAARSRGGAGRGRLHPLVRRRRRQPLADPGRLGARRGADRRRVRGPARRRRRRDPPDRRAHARDRRGRGRARRRPPRSPGKAGAGKVVCIVSGGNIDPRVLARILERRATP